MMGFLSLSTMIVAEIINILASASKKGVADAIAGFIGFKCIIDLGNIYMNSLEDFPMKGAVDKLVFKRGAKDQVMTPMPAAWLFGTIYKILYIFYKSVFFYFFPFAAALLPFFKSLGNNVRIFDA